MAKIEFKGIDEYSKALEILFKDTQKIVESAVYEGAGIVADEIKAGINGIPVQEDKNGLSPYVEDGEKIYGITRRQKADLIDAFGLAPIENDNGYIQTKAGVDGYGSVKTKKYPNGLPNALLMRSVESGTSFRKKHPVFRKAVRNSRKKCEQKMEEVIDKKIKEVMENKEEN